MRLAVTGRRGDREEGDRRRGDSFEQGQPSPQPPAHPPPAGRRVQDAPRGPSPAPDGSSGPQTPLDRQQGALSPNQLSRQDVHLVKVPPAVGRGRGLPAWLTPGVLGTGGDQEPAQTGVPHTCGHVPTLAEEATSGQLHYVCVSVCQTDRQTRREETRLRTVPGQAPGPPLCT